MKTLTNMFADYNYNLTDTQLDKILTRATNNDLRDVLAAYTFLKNNTATLNNMGLRAEFESKTKFMVYDLLGYLDPEDLDD